MYQRPQAPLTIGGVLDDGFQLAKASFAAVFPIALIGSIAAELPITMVSVPVDELPGLGFWAATALYLLITVFVFIALVRAISAVADGGVLSPGEALGGSVGYFFGTVVCGIVYGLIVMLGSILFLIPGILFSISLAFAPYLVITDNSGPIDAIARSHRLVWGNWWRTTAIFAVVLFVTLALYLLVGIAVGVMTFAAEEGSTVTTVVEFVLTVAVVAILSPVAYAFSIAVLNDLKLRSEGDDLAARIEAIDNE